MYIKFNSINSNIGHFLHQELQYLIDLLFKNNNLILLIPEYIINENSYRWHYGILIILEKKLFLKLEKYNKNIKENIYIIESGNPFIIDLKYLIFLQDIVFDYFNISKDDNNQKYTVLYTRIKDTSRRHLINHESLNNNFDLIIHSLNISFEEQVRLFSKCTHFVAPESGAHFVNIIFMKKNSRVMNILTRTDFSNIDNRKENYDSWQLRFNGGANLIKEFNIDTKSTKRIACDNESASNDHDFHDHIYIDNILKDKIINFIKNQH